MDGCVFKSDFVCEMYLFCHSVAVAVGLSHFLILLLIGYLTFLPPLVSNFFSLFSQFLCVYLLPFFPSPFPLFPLSFIHLYPLSPSLSPSCLSSSASACTSVSICLHDCVFAHLLHSLSQIPLCLSSTDNLPGGGSC